MKKNKTILITGGAGFIGANLIEGVLKNTRWNIIVIDRLNLSGKLERLRNIKIWKREKQRVKFFRHDLKSKLSKIILKQARGVDYVWHLAASSHVDRSMEDPNLFVLDNVLGTVNLLVSCRQMPNVKKILYFSTDKVFGSASRGVEYKEWDRYNASNPYAASKAGGEEMAVAFANTYQLPIIITHTVNVFGRWQHQEKFIPMTIRKVLNNETVIIYASKKGNKMRPWSRFYIYAENVFDALLFLMEKGGCLDGSSERGKYNIGGEEIDNLKLAQFIAKIADKPLKYKITDHCSFASGHESRCALNEELMAKLGWNPPKDFKDSLEKTIKWYLQNKKWLNM